MKKLMIIGISIIMLLFTVEIKAQGNAEDAAKDILKAYKTKDVVLLKKYVTGFMAMAVTDEFFEGENAIPFEESIGKWDNDIKEIRYRKGDVMGNMVSLACAHFSDNPNGNLNVVMLTSADGSDWKAFTFGIMEITKEEFNEYSKEDSEDEDIELTKVKDYKAFSIEMANGDTYEAPKPDKLKELLKSLNDDNFFLILSNNDNFLQVSTSDKGYIVQYSDDSGMFEAEAYFTFDQLTEIFNLYLDNDKTWKEKAKWLAM